MKNLQKWIGVIVLVILVIALGIWSNAHHSSSNVSQSPTVTPLSGQNAISFYTNTQHGYQIVFPASVKVVLAGAGDGGANSKTYTPQDTLSTSTSWYASTCVELTDASSTWFITIAADSQWSQVPCARTGTSADSHKEQDTLTVNGSRISVIGMVEPNEASSIYNFSLGKNVTVEYGVTNGNTKDYNTILSSANAVLSTLTLDPHFVPAVQPPAQEN